MFVHGIEVPSPISITEQYQYIQIVLLQDILDVIKPQPKVIDAPKVETAEIVVAPKTRKRTKKE